MASVVDSFKNICSERFGLLKIAVFTFLFYIDYTLYLNLKNDPLSFYVLSTILAFFMFGVIIKIANNVINERTEILPTLNPLTLGYSSAKGIIAMLPSIIVSAPIANKICSFINLTPAFDYTFKTVIWLVAGAIMLTSFLMFAAKEKVMDALKLKILMEKAGDLMLSIVGFVIQFTLINVVTSGFIGYTIVILFGYGPILDVFISFAVAFNIAAAGHFIGQIYYEHIQFSKTNKTDLY